MVKQEHVFDLLSAYALDCLDEAEKTQVSEHLATCEICRAELQTYQDVVDALPLAMVESEPPADLKNKILQQASRSKAPMQQAPKSSWWEQLGGILRRGAPTWGMVSLILILILGVNNLFLWQRLNQLEEKSRSTFRTVTLQNTQTSPGASGLLVISPDGKHGTLVVNGLASLEDPWQYQLWLIRGDSRTNGGVFSVDYDGYSSLWISSPEPLASYSGFGVTIEPAGGSPGPTGAKVLGGEL